MTQQDQKQQEKLIDRLAEILRDVLDEDAMSITEATMMVDLPHWDSLAQIRALISVEEVFGVQFLPDEIAALKSVGQLAALVEAKTA